MKKSRSKRFLIFLGILVLVVFCLAVVHILISAYGRKSSSNEFVGYMITHADEASEDFKDCGIVFSMADETDILSVTFPDGKCFYYQTVADHDDQLVKIERSVEKVWGEETLTGSLEVKRRGKMEASVAIECNTETYTEIRVLNYRVPEFDKYEFTFKCEDTALRISQWISPEELSALYKEGKELEEILSGYCQMKSHGVGFNIHQYTSPYEELDPQPQNNDKGGNKDAGTG